jgi:hypothetical protein
VYLTEKQQILILIVFDLTQHGHKLTIYSTQDENINHYTTDAVQNEKTLLNNNIFTSNEDFVVVIMIVKKLGVRVMVLKATFNNISVISWLSALLVEETRVL